jgi:uncharacterized protein (UPF0303 family)
MPEQTRAARNLAEDITHAHDQLKRARQDGSCTAIIFWTKRRDELLERWRVVTAPAQQPQGSTQ